MPNHSVKKKKNNKMVQIITELKMCGTCTELYSIKALDKRAMKTKYKFGSLKRLLCPDNNDTNFIENFKQVMEILREINEAVVTP